MKLKVLGDFRAESKLEDVLLQLNRMGLRNDFEERRYGDGLEGVSVLLLCQDPALGLRQRIKHSKKDKVFYMDVLFDLDTMRKADDATRMKLVASKIISEVPEVLSRYKIPDFNKDEFIKDLTGWFEKNILS